MSACPTTSRRRRRRGVIGESDDPGSKGLILLRLPHGRLACGPSPGAQVRFKTKLAVAQGERLSGFPVAGETTLAGIGPPSFRGYP